MPLQAGGMKGKRYCDWNTETVVTRWMLEPQWIHLVGARALEKMQPLSEVPRSKGQGIKNILALLSPVFQSSISALYWLDPASD